MTPPEELCANCLQVVELRKQMITNLVLNVTLIPVIHYLFTETWEDGHYKACRFSKTKFLSDIHDI